MLNISSSQIKCAFSMSHLLKFRFYLFIIIVILINLSFVNDYQS